MKRIITLVLCIAMLCSACFALASCGKKDVLTVGVTPIPGMNEKDAKEKGGSYSMPKVMEEMYQQIAAFYSGEQRDFLLYILLRNFIMNGQEIERADVLYKDYVEKYNCSAFHKGILDMLLQ